MDLLKAEINKKRKLNENIHNQVNDSSAECVIGTSKYIRNGDRKRIEEQELQAKQKLLDDERNKNAASVSLAQEKQISASKLLSVVSSAEKKNVSFGQLAKLTEKEIKDKLRQLGQPITYFGESHEDRIQRLLDSIRTNDTSEASRDELRRFKTPVVPDDEEEAALDADDLLEEQEQQQNGQAADGGNSDNESDGGESDADNNEKSNSHKQGKQKSSQQWDHTYHFSEVAGLSDEKVVYKFFRALIKQWEYDLTCREDREKSTAKGKLDTRTQKQCKDCIRPLFKLCKRKEVPFDILVKLKNMVKCCEEGNFRAANDQYIATAIGNAAWPIGLTMVGIHERSGRERISTSKVAHMMNNEMQRKYLTSVKRLMTYAQNKRPDVAPSMKVLF